MSISSSGSNCSVYMYVERINKYNDMYAQYTRKVPYLNSWNFSDPIVEVNALVRHFRQPWVLIRKICQ